MSTSATPANFSQPFVEAQVARTNRNLFLWNGIVLLILVMCTAVMHNYWRGFFHGPFAYDDAALLAAAEHPVSFPLIDYVNVGQRKLIDTGWRQIMTLDDKERSITPYFLMRVGDKMMLVQAESATVGRPLTGSLYEVSNHTRSEVVDHLIKRSPELNGRILPVILNATVAYNVSGYVFLCVIGPFALLCLINIVRGAIRIAVPARHPILRRLALFGEPEAVAREINQETGQGTAMRFGSRLILTPNWLIWPLKFNLKCVRLADIVWIYHNVVTSHGVHSLVVCTRDRKMQAVVLKKGQAPEALAAIAKQVPWAFAGFDLERSKVWRKDPAKVVEAIGKR